MIEAERVLVTGGSGYIASFCIAQLLGEGAHVSTTIRTPSREAEVRTSVGKLVKADDRLKVLVADLEADDGWREACAGAQACCTSPRPSRRALRRTTTHWCAPPAMARYGS